TRRRGENRRRPELIVPPSPAELAMSERERTSPPLTELADESVDAALAAAYGPGSSSAVTADGSSVWEVGSAFRSPVRLPELAAGPPPTLAAAPARRDVGRHEVFGEIARGGMGVVLKGRDATLGRELAVKVLLESHQTNPAMVRRFVEEAQIGGQLQHPGI